VLVRPTSRWAPLPMTLIGRRVFYSEYMRSLLQFAPRVELERRRSLQRAFFQASDPQEALALSQQMGAQYLYLPAGEPIFFDVHQVARRIYSAEGERVFVFPSSGEASPSEPDRTEP